MKKLVLIFLFIPFLLFGQITAILQNTSVATTDTEKPIVGILNIDAVTQTTVDLSWTAATDNIGVTGYKVWQDGVSTDIGNMISYQVTGLSSGVSYNFEVSALDLAGNESNKSNTINITTNSPPLTNLAVLSNFVISGSNPSRVFFDSSIDITGMNTSGFVITGKTISSLTINGTNTFNHYFTVSSPFTFWDNTTIRLGEHTDISDVQTILHNFTLQYITNNLSQSTPTIVRYVSVNGSGANDGTSLTNEWTLTQAMSNATAGTLVYIRKGNYGSTSFTVANSGTVNDPIIFEGYNNSPNDYPTLVKDMSTTFDSNLMPLLINGSNSGTRLSNSNNYIRFRSIQIDGGDYCLDLRGSNYIHLDNVYLRNGRQVLNAFDYDTTSIRIINSYVADATQEGIILAGARHLIENTYVGSTKVVSMDYYIAIRGGDVGLGEHIVRNCTIDRFATESHTGHGISIRASSRGLENVLVEDCEIKEVSQAFQMRHSQVKNCVIRRGNASGGVSGTTNLITFRDDTSYNVIEDSYVEGTESGIKFTMNAGEDAGIQAGGFNNKIINTIFKNVEFPIFIKDGISGTALESTNNSFINCTFYGGTTLIINNLVAFGSSNTFKNVIVEGTTNEGSVSPTFSNSNFFSTFTTPSGIGNISIDPQFVDLIDFVPQNNNLIVAPILYADEYDYNGSERASTTTIGAVKNTTE